MKAISLPVLVMASISLYTGIYHLLVFYRQKMFRKHLTFSLTCFAVGFYDIFAIGVYNANSVAQAAPWQRGQIINMMLFGLAFLWFISDYTDYKPKKVIYPVSAYFLFGAVMHALDRSELTWLSVDMPSIKRIVLWNGAKITYFEMTPGLFTNLQSLISLPIFLFMLWMAIRFFRQGNADEATPLLLSLIVFWLGIFNDIFVSSGLYQFVYLIEYSFLAIILLMALSLASQLDKVSQALLESEKRYRKLSEDLDKRVKERTEQLEATNEELESFSYSISHDLRAPLRAIQGFSEILMDEYASSLGEDGELYLSRVQSCASKMNHLIDDILSLSRLGRKEILFSTTDLGLIAKQVYAEISEDIDREIIFRVLEMPAVNADTDLMKVMWTNLISNAVKFTKKNRVAEITIGTQEGGERPVFYIKDNGVGFDIEKAANLFSPFQRFHSEDEFEGNGIGLAIVAQIIRKHAGKIWADAVPGEGAVFYFTLGMDQAGNPLEIS